MYADDNIVCHSEHGNIILHAEMKMDQATGEEPPAGNGAFADGGCLSLTAYNHFDIKSLSKWGNSDRTSCLRSGHNLMLQAGAPWDFGANIQASRDGASNGTSKYSELMLSAPSSGSHGGPLSFVPDGQRLALELPGGPAVARNLLLHHCLHSRLIAKRSPGCEPDPLQLPDRPGYWCPLGHPRH